MYSHAAGDLGEAQFIVDSIRNGFVPSIPYGDKQPYDMILDTPSGLKKVQIKAAFTARACDGRYAFCTTQKSGRYADDAFDFFACHIIPEGLWYIIPREQVQAIGLHLHPTRGTGKYEQYREAWHLLQ